MPVISLDKIKNGAVLDDSIQQTVVPKSEAIKKQNLYVSDLLKTRSEDAGSGSRGSTPPPAPTKENLYNDLVNQKPKDYSPNAEGRANTGQGAEAAVGTQYSWNKQGTDKAQKQYQADVLAQKDKLLTQAQQTANNAVNYQTQADMMKYQNNQNAEKVGWTGGYVLDQNKQSEYLKASIQAQMYGAMELQKYGYDSALAAARLSYDLNQQEYARQYYNDAVSAALSEAQLTGTYFSAETRDMMSQFAVAEQKLNDPTISEEEKTKAESIKSTIEGWFQENNISKAGVKTMAAYQFEAEQAFQWNTELYTRYQAAVQTLKQDQQNNPNMFFRLDENGNPIFDGMDVATIDFSATSVQDALNYVIQDSKITSNAAKQQLYSYFNWIINDAIAKYKESVAVKDSSGNYIYKINQEAVEKVIKEASNKVAEYISQSDGLLNDYKYTQTDVNIGNINVSSDKDGSTSSSVELNANTTATNNASTIQIVDGSKANWLNTVQQSYPQFEMNSTPTSLGIKASYRTDQLDGNKIDDDFDYTIGNKKYNLDSDWEPKGNGWQEFWASNQFTMFYCNDVANTSSTEHIQDYWNQCQAYLKKAYPNPANGDLAFTNIKLTNGDATALWIYHNGKWGYIQKNNDGKKLYKDLESYINGSTPGNWK